MTATDLLDCIEIETAPNPTHAVIWLHGLGADGNDFAPIVPELQWPAGLGVRFVFPNAPVQRVTIKGPPPLPAGEFPPSGLHFDRALGSRYYAIGTAYGGPSLDRQKSAVPVGSLDAVLGSISNTPFILPLGEPPAPVAPSKYAKVTVPDEAVTAEGA